MANKFWYGGAGNWDGSTTHWSSVSGSSAAQTTAPTSADTAIFDAASGGGTVTVTLSSAMQLIQITMGAFTGTLDFTTNNNNVTLTTAFSGTGTGTRTFNPGTGTWTFSATGGVVLDNATVTNFTCNSSTATWSITAVATGTRTFNGGGKSYGPTTVTDASSNAAVFIMGGSNTFASLTLTPPSYSIFTSGTTTTISSAFNCNGTAFNSAVFISNTAAAVATIASSTVLPTMNWCAIKQITFSSTIGTPAATNSFDLKQNTGITITGPSTEAGAGGAVTGYVIGGG